MSKGIIALILSLMLALGIALAFTSCDGTPPTECTEHKDENGDGICDTEGCGAEVDPSSTPSGEYFNENGELYLFKGGAPTFQFVLDNDAISKNRAEIEDLATVLTSLGNGEVKFVPQNNEAQDVEILVGTITNRGSDYKFDKHELGSNGYMVKQVGTKIIVLGGSTAATAKAVSYLKETVFGIKKNNEKFTDFVMAEKANFTYVQSGYKVTSFTIDGAPISDFTITYPSNDKTASNMANNLQVKLYNEIGVWCEVKPERNFTGKQLLLRSIENDGEGGGFYVKVQDGNLIVECEFEDKFPDLFDKFMEDNLFDKRGAVSFEGTFKYEPDLRTITYEQFGANGNDTLDDFKAIQAAHDEANKYLLKVRANENATYYLTKTSGLEYIDIRTDTYWGSAKFVIVDSDLTTYDIAAMKTDVFHISTDNDSSTFYPTGSSDISKLLKEINENGGIKKDDFTTFDLGLGRDALVYICNNNHRNYVRFGANADIGQLQREFVYLNADGTIASDTRLLYDYTEVTHIEVRFVDDRPITVDGGIFTTIANQLPSNYDWYTHRGIVVNRSNTIIRNLKHYITGESEIGAPYSGFLIVSECSNVTIQDSVLTAHKAYNLEGATNNTMGTYDLSPSNCNRLTILRVTQSNFFEEDGVTTTKIGAGGFWGIMGSNLCKNLKYEDSTLSRFDAHQGTLNASIINSRIGAVTIIGGGKFELIDSQVYAQGSNLITLREDYGSTWCGTMLIKNTEMVLPQSFSGNSVSIIQASWNENELNNPGDKSKCEGPHDFGYDCYLPKSIVLDNFTVSSNNVSSIYLVSGSAYNKYAGNTVNKHFVPEYYEIKNCKKSYNYVDPRERYTELTFVIDGVEQP